MPIICFRLVSFLKAICFILVSFLKAILGSTLKVLYNFDLPVICASVLLGYLLGLVTFDYMLLIMIYIVYSYGSLGGAVVFVFDLIGQLSEFIICYTYKLISNFQIFNYVVSQYFNKNFLYLLLLEQIENFKPVFFLSIWTSLIKTSNLRLTFLFILTYFHKICARSPHFRLL